jgi:predicted glycosyltransferase
VNCIFEINHPGHIHLFRNLAAELESKGHMVCFLIKSDPVTERLAKFYGLNYVRLGSKGKGLVKKIMYQPVFLLKTIRYVKKNKPALGLGVSMNLPMVSKFTKMISIGLDDDDMAVTPVFARYANKASVILTPSSLAHENRGENHITYPGFHELAYLHPNRFNPDEGVFDLLGIPAGTDYFVVRFNSFMAHHDVGEGGMSFEQKRRLVRRLEQKGRVFISSESEIDPEFQSYSLPDRPEWMHSILAFATMYVGESQTMTSEAAVLGTPALKCNTFAGRLSVPNELEQKYGLCYAFLPGNFEEMLKKMDELLAFKNLKAEWQKRKMRMLEEKMDVTAFLVWFVENYPNSVALMKEQPNFFNTWKTQA